jgi:ferredoxin-NADP reductase
VRRRIDQLIDGSTMYRLVLYGLIALALLGLGLTFTGDLSFTALQLMGSAAVLLAAAWIANTAAKRVLGAVVNGESVWITALILLLIMPPATTTAGAWVLAATAAIAMLSKYALAIRRQHLFNPAAIAAVLAGVIWPASMPTWWVGNGPLLLPLVLVGLVLVRKLRRFHLLLTFLTVGTVGMVVQGALATHALGPTTVTSTLTPSALATLLFFGSVMLVEPLTAPPTLRLRLGYALAAGVLFATPYHLGTRLYSTPELALVICNALAFVAAPRTRVLVRLVDRGAVARDTLHFRFRGPTPLRFAPGQYLEWTLPLDRADRRGNRRTFTIASSPTEDALAIGVKVPSHDASAFKRELMELEVGSTIVAAQLAGDFTLPGDQAVPLVFIAGGIGITPFRSMVRWMVDTRQQRDAILFYACTGVEDFAYVDLFDEARAAIGLRVIYLVSHDGDVPRDWKGEIGRLTPDLVAKYVPRPIGRRWYLSGPNAMVRSYEGILRSLGVPRADVRKDYFPGY